MQIGNRTVVKAISDGIGSKIQVDISIRALAEPWRIASC